MRSPALRCLAVLIALSWPAAARADWYAESGGIVHMFSVNGNASPPLWYVARYDLAHARWLTHIPLPGDASSLAVAEGAVYVALWNGTVARYAPNGALVWSTPVDLPIGLALSGGLLFVGGLELRVLDAATGALLDSRPIPLRALSVAPGRRRLFGRDAGLTVAVDFAGDGTLGDPVPGIPIQHSSYNEATWVIRDEGAMLDGTGTVVDADTLAWRTQLRGLIVEDVVPLDDGVLVLHREELILYDDDYSVRGRYSLGGLAGFARGLFVEGERIYLLLDGVVYQFLELSFGDLAPDAPAPALDPLTLAGLAHPEAVAFDGEDRLYLLSQEHRNVFVWSVSANRYLDTLGLLGPASHMLLSRSRERLYLTYPWGIHTLDLDSGREEPWLITPAEPCGLIAAGDHLVLCEEYQEPRLTSIDANGNRVDELDALPFGEELGWSDGTRRLFFFEWGGAVASVELDPSGNFGALRRARDRYASNLPIYAGPDGTVIVGHGEVLHRDTLGEITSLGVLSGAVWTEGALLVLRSGSLSTLDEAYRSTASAPSFGYEGWLFPRGDGALGVWTRFDSSALHVEQIDPGDLDRDGVPLGEDAFPSDPTEWSDRDGDGVGDRADVFPDDPLERSDYDGDGVGDFADAFGDDPTEWSDRDGDHHGDNGDAFPDDPFEWSDRDADGVGDFGDAFPDDPAESIDSDGDGTGDHGDAFPLDPDETRDTDADGVGDRADPYPIGDPFLALALEGEERVRLLGLPALRRGIGGALGLVDGGRFSFCRDGTCLLGNHRPTRPSGRGHSLEPDPGWLEGTEGTLEERVRALLQQELQQLVDVELELQRVRFRLRLDRDGERGRVVLKARFVAKVRVSGSARLRMPGVWVWKFDPTPVVAP